MHDAALGRRRRGPGREDAGGAEHRREYPRSEGAQAAPGGAQAAQPGTLAQAQGLGANRGKAKAHLARLHARIATIRRDATHKATTRLARGWRRIVVEDLNVRGMAANRRLAARSWTAASTSSAASRTTRLRIYGATVIVADRWYPSSRTCSRCGSVLAELDLSQRLYRCASCGLEIDRDLNAARNLKQLAASSAVTACGGTRSGAAAARSARVRTGRVKRVPVKQEPDGRPEQLQTDTVRSA